MITDIVIKVVVAVLSAAILGLCGFIWRQGKEFVHTFQEHDEKLDKRLDEISKKQDVAAEAQKNILKKEIVRSYEEYTERGYITPMELETIEREADSYYDLGGNSYIRTIMKKIDSMDCHGEPVPPETSPEM